MVKQLNHGNWKGNRMYNTEFIACEKCGTRNEIIDDFGCVKCKTPLVYKNPHCHNKKIRDLRTDSQYHCNDECHGYCQCLRK